MKKKQAILLLLTLFCLELSAQNENYVTKRIGEKYAYVDVTKTYEKVAAKGYKSIDLFQKLGNSSYAICNLDKAAKWYGELFAMTYDLDQMYYYRYAESLRFISQNEKADALIERLKRKSKVLVNKK
ncbi:flagellar motor protein MotB [Flavobacterium sp. MDT1-60]|uniref:flagellar motor protein MotB n=1 Tax=Flavobacterium sp. MDT1-60 TaxID=1979344 RepID=UPI001785F72E|nr:flagellar motor protein MotB [Flavobacterium sp. MDT1-60]QOG01886.1 flagellar motor protein MotB [Flavobacterium sp. MDT1-60]